MESGWCELRLCQGAVSLQEEALNKKKELNERLRHQEVLFSINHAINATA